MRQYESSLFFRSCIDKKRILYWNQVWFQYSIFYDPIPRLKILIFSSLHIYFYFFNSFSTNFAMNFFLNNIFQIYFLHDKKTPMEYFLKYLFYSFYITSPLMISLRRIARRNKFKSCGGINAALWIFVCFSLSEKIL